MNITGNIASENPSEEVIEMDQSFFPNPWEASQWSQIDPNLNHLFTWRRDQKLKGFALFGIAPLDDVAHLYKLVILPEFRGGTTAKEFWLQLSDSLIQLGMRRVYLEVEMDNTRAINFYLKVGFQTLRRARGFYSNGRDAFIMELTLMV
jgi:ribosomal-protein-alanine N-acetyltransferase